MGLAAISQTPVEGDHLGVVDGRGEGGHEEHGSGATAAAPDMSGSLEPAAVGGEGGDPDEGRDLSMGQRAEFAHPGDQGGCGDRTDAWNRCENGKRPVQAV